MVLQEEYVFFFFIQPRKLVLTVHFKTGLTNGAALLSLLDSWCELLPTLTRAAADLPALYFLGATDRLHVIGGNNSGNVVTSFCVQSQKWGQVRKRLKETKKRKHCSRLAELQHKDVLIFMQTIFFCFKKNPF